MKTKFFDGKNPRGGSKSFELGEENGHRRAVLQ
jgi:hypothetical protein